MAVEYVLMLREKLSTPEPSLSSPAVWVIIGMVALVVLWTIKR